jgi:hypothetical protein
LLLGFTILASTAAGDGIVRGVDWDRTPSNGELNCDMCDRKFGWRYEIMFHNLCHQVHAA